VSEETSEFGKGFLYPLSLFLAHEWQLKNNIKSYKELREKAKNTEIFSEDQACVVWLCGAGDHLYEFMPEFAPKHLAQKAYLLKRLNDDNKLDLSVTKKICEQMNDLAKDIFFGMDLHMGVAAVRGEWE